MLGTEAVALVGKRLLAVVYAAAGMAKSDAVYNNN